MHHQKNNYIICQNFIPTHAHRLIRATQGVRSKHYTSNCSYLTYAVGYQASWKQ